MIEHRPSQNPDGWLTLTRCLPGTDAVMTSAEAGGALQGRLAAMGLVPGVRLRVLRKDRRGPLVIAVHGARLAVGRNIADRIHVRVMNP